MRLLSTTKIRKLNFMTVTFTKRTFIHATDLNSHNRNTGTRDKHKVTWIFPKNSPFCKMDTHSCVLEHSLKRNKIKFLLEVLSSHRGFDSFDPRWMSETLKATQLPAKLPMLTFIIPVEEALLANLWLLHLEPVPEQECIHRITIDQ